MLVYHVVWKLFLQNSTPRPAAGKARALSMVCASRHSNVNTFRDFQKILLCRGNGFITAVDQFANACKKAHCFTPHFISTKILIKLLHMNGKWDIQTIPENKNHNPYICYSGKMHLINLTQKISFHLIQSEIVGHFCPWDHYNTLCQRLWL